MKCWFVPIILLISSTLFAQEPRLVLPIGHPQGIRTIRVTPDAKHILTQSFNDVNVKLWDTRTGKLVRDINMGENTLLSNFSADGKLLFVAGSDSMRIIHTSTGLVIATHEGSADDIIFSPDGSSIITRRNKIVCLWNASTLQSIQQITMEDSVSTISYLKTANKILVEEYRDGQFRFSLFDSSLKNKQELKKPGEGIGFDFAEIKDSLYMIRFNNNMVYFHQLDPTTLEVTKTVSDTLTGSLPICSSYDKKNGNVLYGLKDSTMHLLNVDDGLLYSYDKFDLGVTNVEFVNGGKHFVHKNNYDVCFRDTEEGNTLQWFLFDEQSRDLKNTGESIAYNAEKNKFYLVLADNIVREFTIQDDSCRITQTFTGETKNVVESSVKNKKLRLGDGVGQIKSIDLAKAEVESSLDAHFEVIGDVGFSGTGEFAVTGSWDSTIKYWHLPSKQLKRKLTFKLPVLTAQIHDSNKVLLAGATDLVMEDDAVSKSSFHLFNLQTGVKLYSINGRDRLASARFSKNGQRIFYCNQTDSTVVVTDLTFKKIATMKSAGWVFVADQSEKGNHIVVVTNINVELYDAGSYKLLQSFPIDNWWGFHRAVVSADGKLLATGTGRGFVAIWDIATNKMLFRSKTHTSAVIPAFTDQSHLVTCSEDGTVKYWKYDSRELQLVYQLVPFHNNEYIATIPTGYYKGSRDAATKLHYVTNDQRIISFEQLDVKYNRPDKVLEAIGNTDTALINSYRKAYLKRIRRLGLDTSSFKEGFTLPEADFKNRNTIASEQKTKDIKLHVTGSSSEDLDRFNIWINEVPLYGQRGVSLRGKLSKELDTSLTIQLSEGMNRIETSVTDVNGIESYRLPLSVNYIPPTPAQAKIYFIGIGINRFVEKENNLAWSVKDIRDLARQFSKKGAIIDTLFDEKVTIENIVALKKRLENTTEEDKVIVSYSGHGLLSKDYDYFLSTYNISFAAPEKNGLPYEELEALLDGIKARKKLLLIDACHSGEVDKEEMKQIAIQKTVLQQKGTKGGKITYTGNNQVGMKNSFELMQDLFLNIERGTGATIISAAAGTQFAQESGALKNGVFTYCLLQALKTPGPVRISDLKQTVLENVPRLTNGLQKPTFRNETRQNDWELW